jgi:hypothetical protein
MASPTPYSCRRCLCSLTTSFTWTWLLSTADAKSELHQYWKLWGLEDASSIGNFAMLSSNVETNPKCDFVSDKFARGRGTFKLLFDHYCFAIAPLPSNCVWVDLVFSQMKNAQNFNESEESLGHILVYNTNGLHQDRNERREVLHRYQSAASKHLHTLPQIACMCKQLLALLPRYAWKNMAEIPGRKPLSRHLTSAYNAVDEKTLEVKKNNQVKSS